MSTKQAETIKSWDVVFPNDANPAGTMFGGKLMAVMDKVASIAAAKFSDRLVVTASTEAITFKRPIKVGDRIQTIAKVVWVGRTSMVIKVDVYAEHPITSRSLYCTTAHFNFVALDEEGCPTEVPQLRIETEAEKKDYEVAEFVKKQALERSNKLKNIAS